MSGRFNSSRNSAKQFAVRPAVSEDANAIARIFLESAEHHATLDPLRYVVPTFDVIIIRYREGQRQWDDADRRGITLVAELGGEIVGFIDARLERSPDPMHRELLYCDIAEIAVKRRDRNKGIGGELLQAAEIWGRKHGADYASLEYHAANTSAGEFYQRRMGYQVPHITVIKGLQGHV